MNAAVQAIALALFDKPLDECGEAELIAAVNRQPYFAPLQLLLTVKQQQSNTSNLAAQRQKTFLYFNNPLRLGQLLQSDAGTANVTLAERRRTEVADSHDRVTDKVDLPHDDTVAADNTMEEAKQPVPESIIPPADSAASATIPMTELPIKEVGESLEEKELVIDQTEENTNAANSAEEGNTPEIKLPEFKIEHFDPAKAELSLTPYHTIDYFASLGIRFREEEKPVDKFGQQLKSFTDWIKVMRKLPVAEMAKNNDVLAEKKIEKMAEHSVEGQHALTEAMAEVWDKQGQKEKAAEVYRKLSLLDPAKSAYFAAKIEQLKTN